MKTIQVSFEKHILNICLFVLVPVLVLAIGVANAGAHYDGVQPTNFIIIAFSFYVLYIGREYFQKRVVKKQFKVITYSIGYFNPVLRKVSTWELVQIFGMLVTLCVTFFPMWKLSLVFATVIVGVDFYLWYLYVYGYQNAYKEAQIQVRNVANKIASSNQVPVDNDEVMKYKGATVVEVRGGTSKNSYTDTKYIVYRVLSNQTLMLIASNSANAKVGDTITRNAIASLYLYNFGAPNFYTELLYLAVAEDKKQNK